MPIAAPTFKQLAYKLETTYGTAAGQTGGQLINRKDSSFDINKDSLASSVIRTDFQRSDVRHGVRRGVGKLSTDLMPKVTADFHAAALKRAFAAGASAAAVSLTIAGSGPTYTVTRAAGSFLTDGFKTGNVIRLTVGALNASNINKNLVISSVTATVATVYVVNGSAMVAEGPVTGCTVTVFGKRTFVPQTGHTDQSFTVEEWMPDLGQSELYLGEKPDKLSINFAPGSLAEISIDFMGQDVADTPAKRGGVALSSQYFTTPTAALVSTALAAVNGIVLVNGVKVSNITNMSFEIDPSYGGSPVVGSNIIPALFAGPVTVSGTMSAYFDTTTARDAYWQESTISLTVVLTTDNTAASSFLVYQFDLIKLMSASKSDNASDGVIREYKLEMLLNAAGGTGTATELTTVAVQDSDA